MLPRKASLSLRRLEACNTSCMVTKVCLSPILAHDFVLPSLQTDASDFLRKYPWPGRAIADTFDDSSHRHGALSKRIMNTLKIVCGRTGDIEDVYDDPDYDDERVMYDASESNDSERPFYWSQTLQKSFREELEKYGSFRRIIP